MGPAVWGRNISAQVLVIIRAVLGTEMTGTKSSCAPTGPRRIIATRTRLRFTWNLFLRGTPLDSLTPLPPLAPPPYDMLTVSRYITPD
ncbi:hypothetical protein B0H16DRAFT_1510798 [Mycena metata]|uniref:Secreted protein n=1 Tax=Mycena metata TaxID=1033252 RepID=A0AAD7JXN4_9AGAR|nr:hypothetical protein B0H16DRAFT_1510798 [Mycena metata]